MDEVLWEGFKMSNTERTEIPTKEGERQEQGSALEGGMSLLFFSSL